MIHFRIRDLISVLFYRLLAPFFGTFGRRVRIVFPLRIWGARHFHLGDDVTLQYGAYIAVLRDHERNPRLEIGQGTMVGNHAHIVCTQHVAIGTRVLIADRVFISDNGHEYRDPSRAILDQGQYRMGLVAIGDGSWIGENAVILGCRIGRNCVIGANSVVTRDIPDFCVAIGSPARIVRRYHPATDSWRPTDRSGQFADE
ncbi:acyltransferase [Sphingomonas sp. MAH-20]|jgi:acetyltransferase-like isoleucine patch superfamily enzyme|uniref:Acyltransferase n=1 Tax=Sphingomonas horti TaxID=2682842 RepID=A0A6I4J0E6_9SPHN|nr:MULTISPECIES: acyltransferase [Sphingomonas]MBA2919768.1 acyltransferase [Sphingomonas sp. CGMCC 1.13658]MVO78009.1 acyltransferase [Sphingomonas horti]